MEEKVKAIIRKYGSDKSFLIPILQDIQRQFNYLPREALDALSVNLGIPPSLVYHISTFYKAFSLTPKGRYRMSLCMGTACHVRGAPLIGDHIERTLGMKAGETSKDLEYSYETVNCLGACALGPILVVNDEYHGQMTIAKANKVLASIGVKVQSDEEA